MKKISGSVYLFCAFTLAGSSVLPARYVTGILGPFTITAISQLFALAFLLPLSWRNLRQVFAVMPARDYFLVVLQALFGMFLFRLFFLNGIKLTSAGEAGILTGATPAITAVLAVILLKEHTGRGKAAGIIFTVLGIILLQGIMAEDKGFSMKHLGGNILVLCAAASESTFNIFSRKFALRADRKYEFPPIVQTAAVSFTTLLLCLIPAAFEHTSPFSAGIGMKEWFALIWYGVFVTALAFICWYSGINRSGAVTAAAFSGMMPLTSMLLSILILDEKLGWQQCLGGILIITGMIIIGIGNAPKHRAQG